jgi:hypothetical protein
MSAAATHSVNDEYDRDKDGWSEQPNTKRTFGRLRLLLNEAPQSAIHEGFYADAYILRYEDDVTGGMMNVPKTG